ncbi:hypothetical protein GCM10011403_24930 [Pseudohongiella nitratireducens]|uniref:cGAS/DncV-like nucleotidyltransferase C-terminal helical domain-containing protein n=1 Tax=Pseudohongiella nitratireducens TaxID=1768907 RepID=A0A916VJW1_9GAMM|nr:hypothetical protein [Pseudohongiella nitratireducens]GFZ80800.1 hypothetical protein GCM10011403_24930 [Pseudohongiella nitratireducens]
MINFDARLKRLKDRRQGTRELVLLEKGFHSWDTGDYRIRESYEELSESPGVRYAIGSMSAVNPESTKVSINEGNRVSDTLISMLKTEGIGATKRIQGSVALDIHIEGHSDVDMLIICEDTILVQTPKLDGSTCYAADNRPMVEIIAELRNKSEQKLTTRYYETDVDCTNSKSISLVGGSLKRKVDIVPSCWYHTHDYQRSRQERDIGIKIYHKKEHRLLGNFPFKHIARVNDKDTQYSGNLKKVIRLLKNLVADMPDYKKGKAKKLTSYDLAGIAYHMDQRLNVPSYMPLALVEQTRDFLSLLNASETYRNTLTVPDDTRKIFDDESKKEALEIITKEVEDLAYSIFRELRPLSQVYDGSVIESKVI